MFCHGLSKAGGCGCALLWKPGAHRPGPPGPGLRLVIQGSGVVRCLAAAWKRIFYAELWQRARITRWSWTMALPTVIVTISGCPVAVASGYWWNPWAAPHRPEAAR